MEGKMSKGKYSPRCPNADKEWEFYDRNCYGDVPPPYDPATDTYDEKIHFATYDPEGYDSYGYSAFDRDRNFVGCGQGIDRLGYTEMEYLGMSDDEFEDVSYQ
jgi:hypothetical protein